MATKKEIKKNKKKLPYKISKVTVSCSFHETIALTAGMVVCILKGQSHLRTILKYFSPLRLSLYETVHIRICKNIFAKSVSDRRVERFRFALFLVEVSIWYGGGG